MKSAFVDLQVNGYAGVDFSSPLLTREEVEKVCRALFKQGTGAFLATIVTASETICQQILPILAETVNNPPEGALLVGIHLEGPFIFPVEGARGGKEGRRSRRRQQC